MRLKTREMLLLCGSLCIRGAPLPHTPAARGIQAGTRIDDAALTDLLSAALPSGMLEPDLQFSHVLEEVDGVRLSFQVCLRVTAATLSITLILQAGLLTELPMPMRMHVPGVLPL